MSEGKILGIISLKGGVGKTSVVANVGASLAQDFGKKVLMVDANFSTPHLGLHLGLVKPEVSLHHILNEDVGASQGIYRHPLGLHFIAGSLSPPPVNPLALKEKIDSLRSQYDYILLDSSPALNDEMYATIAASDEVFVVSTPDYPTLTATLQAIDVARRKQGHIKGIIINKVRKKRFELTKKDVESVSDIEVLGLVPDDVKVLEALASMVPVTAYSPKEDVAVAFKKLTGKIIGEKYRKPRLFSKSKSVKSFSRKENL